MRRSERRNNLQLLIKFWNLFTELRAGPAFESVSDLVFWQEIKIMTVLWEMCLSTILAWVTPLHCYEDRLSFCCCWKLSLDSIWWLWIFFGIFQPKRCYDNRAWIWYGDSYLWSKRMPIIIFTQSIWTTEWLAHQNSDYRPMCEGCF